MISLGRHSTSNSTPRHRSDAFYIAHQEAPGSKCVQATLKEGLKDVRIFSRRIPDDIAMSATYNLLCSETKDNTVLLAGWLANN